MKSEKQKLKTVEIKLADMEIIINSFLDKKAYAPVLEDCEREIKRLKDNLIKERIKNKNLGKELKKLKKKIKDWEKEYNKFDILDFGEED